MMRAHSSIKRGVCGNLKTSFAISKILMKPTACSSFARWMVIVPLIIASLYCCCVTPLELDCQCAPEHQVLDLASPLQYIPLDDHIRQVENNDSNDNTDRKFELKDLALRLNRSIFHLHNEEEWYKYSDRYSYPEGEPIILVTTSAPFFEMTLNWYLSVKQTNVSNEVLIVCHDTDVIQRLESHVQPGDTVGYYPVTVSGAQNPNYGTGDYKNIVSARPEVILLFATKGIPIIYSDVDTVWRDSPLPYVREMHRKGYDLVTTADNFALYNSEHCTGFIAVNSNPSRQSIDFLNEWREDLLTHTVVNQPSFNALATAYRDVLKIGILSLNRFPYGDMYFGWLFAPLRSGAVIVHNNYIKGYDNKIQRFKNYGLWWLGESRCGGHGCRLDPQLSFW